MHGGTPRVAKVLFYDVAEPESPRRLPVEITRPGRKASATALTRLANGHYLAAVLAAFDGLPLRLDFYLSRSTMLDDGFLPEPVMWPVSGVAARPGQDRTFNHFQTINFIRQADGRLYLVGFREPRRAAHDPARARLRRPVRSAVSGGRRCPDSGHADGHEGGKPDAPLHGWILQPRRGGGIVRRSVTKAMSVYATPGWLMELR